MPSLHSSMPYNKLKTIKDMNNKHTWGIRLAFVLLMCVPFGVFAERNTPRVIPSSLADDLSTLFIEYKDRVCPMETYAQDFTTKLCGRATYRGRSSVEVLAGWMFYPDSWKPEPMIKVKGQHLKALLGTEESHVSLLQFADHQGNYKLEKVMAEIRATTADGGSNAVVPDERKILAANEQVSLVNSLITGSSMKIFPIKDKNGWVVWYAATDDLPEGLDINHWTFIRKSLDLLAEHITMGRYDEAHKLIVKIHEYQEKEGGSTLPSASDVRLEHAYNWLAACMPLSLGCIIGAIISFLLLIVYRMLDRPMPRWLSRTITSAWAFITFYIILRTIGSHYFQFATGFEITLLFTSHIAVIFTAYSIFTFLTLESIMELCRSKSKKASSKNQVSDSKDSGVKTQVSGTRPPHPYMLHLGVFLLALGIVIGSVWAKIAWGRYWGWDPKETWALITLIIYLILLVFKHLKARKAKNPSRCQFERLYHFLVIIAFLSVLMTYFGVNTFLPGLHSYA